MCNFENFEIRINKSEDLKWLTREKNVIKRILSDNIIGRKELDKKIQIISDRINYLLNK